MAGDKYDKRLKAKSFGPTPAAAAAAGASSSSDDEDEDEDEDEDDESSDDDDDDDNPMKLDANDVIAGVQYQGTRVKIINVSGIISWCQFSFIRCREYRLRW